MRKLCVLLAFLLLFGGALADGAAFDDMTDACRFVRQEARQGTSEITLTLTDDAVDHRSAATIRDILTDVLEYCESYEIAFADSRKGLEITVSCLPRPGLKMLHAWETGDRSALTAEESACLDHAFAIAEACRAGKRSALETELAVYQYICRHVTYAHDAVAKGTGTPEYLRASTCLGALVDGAAQCQGYAEAFWLLGTLSGLDVETQYGWAGGGVAGKHAWNTIRLGHHTYMVDVCWGDTSGDSFEPDTPDYRTFNAGLDRLPAERRWHPEAEVTPISTVTDHHHSAFAGITADAVTVASLDEAVQYAMAQHHRKESYAHVFIPGQSISVSKAQDAMLAAIRSAGISTKWGRLAHEYAGGTYLIIRWVHN